MRYEKSFDRFIYYSFTRRLKDEIIQILNHYNEIFLIEVMGKIIESLKELQVSYLDMVLIHSPVPNKRAVAKFMSPEALTKLDTINDFAKVRIEIWTALQIGRQNGMIKHIGVSNFTRRHIEELISNPR